MYCKDPNEESHSIVCEDEYGEKVIVPLFLKGVTSYFNTEPLTREEFEAHDCPRIIMTNKDLTWDPNSDVYENQENDMIDHQGEVINRNVPERRPLMSINSVNEPERQSLMSINSVCLTRGALELYEHCCPVGVQTYDQNLGMRTHRTIATKQV